MYRCQSDLPWSLDFFRGIEGLAISLCAKNDYIAAATLLGAAEKGRAVFGGDTQANFSIEHEEALDELLRVFT